MISPGHELQQKPSAGCTRGARARASAGGAAATSTRHFPDWVSGAACWCGAATPRRWDCSTSASSCTRRTPTSAPSLRARGRRILFTPARRPSPTLRGRSAAAAPRATRAAYRRSQVAFYEKHHPGWARVLRALPARQGRVAPEGPEPCAILTAQRRLRSGDDRGPASGPHRPPASPTPAVRIAIDARKLHDYGIGTYVRNLLRQLAQASTAASELPRSSATARTTRCALRAWARTSGRMRRRRWPRIAAGDQFGDAAPAEAHRARASTTRRTRCCRWSRVCPSVVTIHDCVNLTFPQYAPNRLAQTLDASLRMWSAAHRSAGSSPCRSPPSATSCGSSRCPRRRSSVIPNAIDERFGVAA